MKEFFKKNFAVVLAFVLPIVFITIIALSTYLPSRLPTDYNFLYVSCTNSKIYLCTNYLSSHYLVINNKLVLGRIEPTQDIDKNGIPDIDENYAATFFLYDTKKNESRAITLEEAQTLTLDGSLTSPDGVTILNEYHRGGDFFFLFGNKASYGHYLTKGKYKFKLNIVNNRDYYYQNDFQFIGWVLPGRNQ